MAMSDQMPTMPNPALQPNKRQQPKRGAVVPQPVPAASPRQIGRAAPRRQGAPKSPPRPRKKSRRSRKWLWLIPVGLLSLMLMFITASVIGVGLIYNRGILPGVEVGDVRIGGLSPDRAARVLSDEWSVVALRDGERTWNVTASSLGMQLDVERTVNLAYAQGRGEGSALSAILGTVNLTPAVSLNVDTAASKLNELKPQLEVAPVNAGVAFENGEVVATLPENGRMLDVNATVEQLTANPEMALAGGALQLVMYDVTPEVTDAAPLVSTARAILNNPLDIQVYDPVTGDSVVWSLAPEQWGQWLTAVSDPESAIGLALSADEDSVRSYLTAQANNALDDSRSIDIDAGVASVLDALERGRPDQATVTIEHQPRSHTVQPGESLTSIAYDYGIPYPYIQQANNGISSLSVGQTITIPAADTFLLKPVIPNKRIVVSIPQQRVRVYENGQLKWDWLASTGISDSPTWPGIYQIISHVPNAYAGNWNLHMPNFMGVYAPVPGSDFTNGFHGFPTRGGGQLLWTNNLGSRVTYGCIMVSDANIRQLYDWAEDGVVVEIQG